LEVIGKVKRRRARMTRSRQGIIKRRRSNLLEWMMVHDPKMDQTHHQWSLMLNKGINMRELHKKRDIMTSSR
jgi:hypothetical protein